MICPKCGVGSLRVMAGRTINETPGETIQQRACDSCEFVAEVVAVVTAELEKRQVREKPGKLTP